MLCSMGFAQEHVHAALKSPGGRACDARGRDGTSLQNRMGADPDCTGTSKELRQNDQRGLGIEFARRRHGFRVELGA